MLVKFLRTIATQAKVYKKGQEYEIDIPQGTEFCEIGYCEPIAKDKIKETATSKESAKRTTRKK